MLLQVLPQGFAKDAHAAAVDDADARQSGQEGAVYEFLQFSGSFVHGAANYVDLAGRVEVARFVLQLDGDASGAGGFDGRRLRLRFALPAGQHFGDIFAGDAHLHRADLDIEMILANFLFDDGGAAHGFELYRVAFGDVLDQAGLGVWVSAVGTGRVRYYRGIELLAKFAAHFSDAALGIFR